MDANFTLHQPPRQPLFEANAFDRAIQAHGLTVEIHRCLPCPGGNTTRYDARRPHEDHLGCQGSFLYRLAGSCRAIFWGNSTNRRPQEPGIVAQSSGSVTFERFYSGGPSKGQPVRVTQYDRLYLLDASVLVENWQKVDHRADGVDRLEYPAEQVLLLVTASGRQFGPGDFVLRQGRIEWGGPNRPLVGPDGRGEVYSVRYLYRPYWYVSGQHHDLRFFTVAAGDGVAVTAVHQSVSVQREYFYFTEDRDQEAPASRRQVSEPEDPPQFGPR